MGKHRHHKKDGVVHCIKCGKKALLSVDGICNRCDERLQKYRKQYSKRKYHCPDCGRFLSTFVVYHKDEDSTIRFVCQTCNKVFRLKGKRLIHTPEWSIKDDTQYNTADD